MTTLRGGRLAATFAVTALASGLFLSLPSSSARAASLIDVAPVSSLDSDRSPVEMQRRGGGFRGGGGGFRGPRPGPRPGFRGGRGGRGGGNVGAAIGLGAAALIIGGAAAAAASQRESYRECWIERRWVDGPYGPERRRVRICD